MVLSFLPHSGFVQSGSRRCLASSPNTTLHAAFMKQLGTRLNGLFGSIQNMTFPPSLVVRFRRYEPMDG
ncbi:protein of unknown function [Shewanella benthica]|uniref:Uncharacterized protein n=1 Tax=Shewanella benthica TaxID=43661 RepID=A0A330LZX0_9GAMM|nr:protein of unknown function [Shewanella benthica]